MRVIVCGAGIAAIATALWLRRRGVEGQVSERAEGPRHEPADRETAGHGSGRAPITSRRPTGVLRWLLRLPIWLYHAHLGWMLGHRMIYIAHRGRRSGARHEVVVEVVRYDPRVPEVFVIAAWGGTPDWYRNLRAAPAIEVRTGRHRWPAPVQRFPDAVEILRVLRAYQRAHPAAFRQLGPRLGFPADPTDPSWPEVAARVHAVTFRPAGR
jgi:deazaflavin-dependent oxidoreductase (nitroreductase family)